MTEEPQGFFGRWARRKNEVLKGETPAEPVILEPAPSIAALPALPALPESAVALPAIPDDDEAIAGPQEQKLSLEDVRVLTKDSDFKPFMAQGVDASVRNAAVKKLFTDPHFNLMDGLDIYIDDYSKPDPIPEAMLRQMTSVEFLGLFADEDDVKKQALVKLREDTNNPAAETIAQSSESAVADSDASASDQPPIQTAPLPAATEAVVRQEAHAYTDLRLQPDHATPAPSAGSCT